MKVDLFGDDRGVQWTIEAFLAVLLLFTTLAVTLDTVANSGEASSDQFAEYQLQRDAGDVLAIARAEGNLSRSLLYWNTTAAAPNGTWINDSQPPPGEYTILTSEDPNHPLSRLLASTLVLDNVRYNLAVVYENDSAPGNTSTKTMVFQGSPGSDAATDTTSVRLLDGDAPAAANASSDGDPCTLEEIHDDTNGCGGSQGFYAPDAHPGANLYNEVRVRITVWRG
jgi:hypothetical protein